MAGHNDYQGGAGVHDHQGGAGVYDDHVYDDAGEDCKEGGVTDTDNSRMRF